MQSESEKKCWIPIWKSLKISNDVSPRSLSSKSMSKLLNKLKPIDHAHDWIDQKQSL